VASSRACLNSANEWVKTVPGGEAFGLPGNVLF
jgi:hypothetical protein